MTTQPTYQVPFHNRVWRGILRPFFRGLYHTLARVNIQGRELVPKSGSYIIAINHISLYDPPLVVAFWPRCPEAAGAAELWSRPSSAFLARAFGGIQVHRQDFDRKLFDQLVAVLKSGRPLLIAPEGTRSHQIGMQRGQPGVAYLADLTGAPIVPAGVTGTTDDMLSQGLRGRQPEVGINIGAPFQLPPVEGRGAARREARQRNADQIMQAIAELLPPEYHGVYGPGFDPDKAPPPGENLA